MPAGSRGRSGRGGRHSSSNVTQYLDVEAEGPSGDSSDDDQLYDDSDADEAGNLKDFVVSDEDIPETKDRRGRHRSKKGKDSDSADTPLVSRDELEATQRELAIYKAALEMAKSLPKSKKSVSKSSGKATARRPKKNELLDQVLRASNERSFKRMARAFPGQFLRHARTRHSGRDAATTDKRVGQRKIATAAKDLRPSSSKSTSASVTAKPPPPQVRQSPEARQKPQKQASDLDAHSSPVERLETPQLEELGGEDDGSEVAEDDEEHEDTQEPTLPRVDVDGPVYRLDERTPSPTVSTLPTPPITPGSRLISQVGADASEVQVKEEELDDVVIKKEENISDPEDDGDLDRRAAYDMELSKLRIEKFDIDPRLLTRARLRGQYKITAAVTDDEVGRDAIRKACGMRNNLEVCSIKKTVRITLVNANIPITIPWSKLTIEEREKCIREVALAFRESRPFWNMGMIRQLCVDILGDGSKLTAKKRRGYQPKHGMDYERSDPRPKSYFIDADFIRKQREQKAKTTSTTQRPVPATSSSSTRTKSVATPRPTKQTQAAVARSVQNSSPSSRPADQGVQTKGQQEKADRSQSKASTSTSKPAVRQAVAPHPVTTADKSKRASKGESGKPTNIPVAPILQRRLQPSLPQRGPLRRQDRQEGQSGTTIVYRRSAGFTPPVAEHRRNAGRSENKARPQQSSVPTIVIDSDDDGPSMGDNGKTAVTSSPSPSPSPLPPPRLFPHRPEFELHPLHPDYGKIKQERDATDEGSAGPDENAAIKEEENAEDHDLSDGSALSEAVEWSDEVDDGEWESSGEENESAGGFRYVRAIESAPEESVDRSIKESQPRDVIAISVEPSIEESQPQDIIEISDDDETVTAPRNPPLKESAGHGNKGDSSRLVIDLEKIPSQNQRNHRKLKQAVSSGARDTRDQRTDQPSGIQSRGQPQDRYEKNSNIQPEPEKLPISPTYDVDVEGNIPHDLDFSSDAESDHGGQAVDPPVPVVNAPTTLRVHLIKNPRNYSTTNSVLLSLYRRFTLRQFIASVEVAMTYDIRYNESFLCYAPVRSITSAQVRPWRIIRDVKDVVDLFLWESMGRGVFMCELRWSLANSIYRDYFALDDFSNSFYTWHMVRRSPDKWKRMQNYGCYSSRPLDSDELLKMEYDEIYPEHWDTQGDSVKSYGYQLEYEMDLLKMTEETNVETLMHAERQILQQTTATRSGYWAPSGVMVHIGPQPEPKQTVKMSFPEIRKIKKEHYEETHPDYVPTDSSQEADSRGNVSLPRPSIEQEMPAMPATPAMPAEYAFPRLDFSARSERTGTHEFSSDSPMAPMPTPTPAGRPLSAKHPKKTQNPRVASLHAAASTPIPSSPPKRKTDMPPPASSAAAKRSKVQHTGEHAVKLPHAAAVATHVGGKAVAKLQSQRAEARARKDRESGEDGTGTGMSLSAEAGTEPLAEAPAARRGKVSRELAALGQLQSDIPASTGRVLRSNTRELAAEEQKSGLVKPVIGADGPTTGSGADSTSTDTRKAIPYIHIPVPDSFDVLPTRPAAPRKTAPRKTAPRKAAVHQPENSMQRSSQNVKFKLPKGHGSDASTSSAIILHEPDGTAEPGPSILKKTESVERSTMGGVPKTEVAKGDDRVSDGDRPGGPAPLKKAYKPTGYMAKSEADSALGAQDLTPAALTMLWGESVGKVQVLSTPPDGTAPQRVYMETGPISDPVPKPVAPLPAVLPNRPRTLISPDEVWTPPEVVPDPVPKPVAPPPAVLPKRPRTLISSDEVWTPPEVVPNEPVRRVSTADRRIERRMVGALGEASASQLNQLPPVRTLQPSSLPFDSKAHLSARVRLAAQQQQSRPRKSGPDPTIEDPIVISDSEEEETLQRVQLPQRPRRIEEKLQRAQHPSRPAPMEEKLQRAHHPPRPPSPHIPPRRDGLPKYQAPYPTEEEIMQLFNFPKDRRTFGNKYKFMLDAIRIKLRGRPRNPWGIRDFDWQAYVNDYLSYQDGLHLKRKRRQVEDKNADAKRKKEQKAEEESQQKNAQLARRPRYSTTPPPGVYRQPSRLPFDL
ncbi:hypothetical protein BJ508DRAFT_328767 [Ascobolus immersus RN42]|uniref:Uncharacterized protein n=1 Tax=Ascobolus immersus RN42 TaxID=1160509 RepID=A0A3N4I0S5_ASCIM|nr:hypothetical protein BJ508DRAFT_328767 [Ascobolus immersus RN42]